MIPSMHNIYLYQKDTHTQYIKICGLIHIYEWTLAKGTRISGLWSKWFLGLFTNLNEGSSFDNLALEHFLFGLEEIVTSFLQRQSSCKMKFCPHET
jgi:hypothetical protein